MRAHEGNSALLPTPVSYARTKDGISIAFWAAGSGPPLIFMPSLTSNVSMEWHSSPPHRGELYQELSRTSTLVRYDGRGQGLSQRKAGEVSLETLEMDLEAVADQLGFESFALLTSWVFAPIGMSFAAHHPERVSKLILWQPYTAVADYFDQANLADLMPLAETNWPLFLMTAAHVREGWEHGERARYMANLRMNSIDPDFFRTLWEHRHQLDARCLAPQIKMPTLVMHRQDFQDPPMTASMALAADIPGARLSILEGNSNIMYDGEDAQALEEIEDFLEVDAEQRHRSRPRYLRNRSSRLSPREIDVLRLLASGYRNKEMAQASNVSVHTVERQVASIYAKIGVGNRADATRYAIRSGLIKEPAPLAQAGPSRPLLNN